MADSFQIGMIQNAAEPGRGAGAAPGAAPASRASPAEGATPAAGAGNTVAPKTQEPNVATGAATQISSADRQTPRRALKPPLSTAQADAAEATKQRLAKAPGQVDQDFKAGAVKRRGAVRSTRQESRLPEVCRRSDEKRVSGNRGIVYRGDERLYESVRDPMMIVRLGIFIPRRTLTLDTALDTAEKCQERLLAGTVERHEGIPRRPALPPV